MARQSGIIQYRGRLGETVGMRNGFGGAENFTRSYNPSPKNPQTTSQVDVRAKMLPAVLFRRQLHDIIARGFEGVKYGGPSIRRYMRYALREPWPNVPQLVKDSVVPIPGAYLISRGSLPTISCRVDNGRIVTSLKMATLSPDPQTDLGEISTSLLEENPHLREGDQLTFVSYQADDDGLAYYAAYSFILDTSSTETPLEAMGCFLDENGDYLTADLVLEDNTTSKAGTCVHSRQGRRTALRSTQRMALDGTTAMHAAYFAPTLKSSVAASYQTQSSGRSVQDWPYEGEQP